MKHRERLVTWSEQRSGLRRQQLRGALLLPRQRQYRFSLLLQHGVLVAVPLLPFRATHMSSWLRNSFEMMNKEY